MIPKKVREQVIERAQGRCERHGGWLGDDYSIHHRKLRSQGGRDEPVNLAVICGSGTTGCHNLVHSRRLEIGEPEGFIVKSRQDPAVIPMHHHALGPVLLMDDASYLIVAA